jgi:hypothetical protein
VLSSVKGHEKMDNVYVIAAPSDVGKKIQGFGLPVCAIGR